MKKEKQKLPSKNNVSGVKESSMITCDYCGTAIDVTKDRLCPGCSAPYNSNAQWLALRSTGLGKTAEDVAENGEIPETEIPPKTDASVKKRRIVLIASSLILVLAVAYVTWLCLNGRGVSVGDIVIFGEYEQDNDSSNGKEPIEWRVLEKKRTSILVISDKALVSMKYDDTPFVPWENCDVREWLESNFVDTAFSAEEQALILHTPIYGSTDQVFLLSIDEVEKYFPSESERLCMPTEYCIYSRGLYTTEVIAGANGCCSWLLRSPGFEYQDLMWYQAAVSDTGEILHGGNCNVTTTYECVRPAMWIKLDS